jgi:hypothetical protein
MTNWFFTCASIAEGVQKLHEAAAGWERAIRDGRSNLRFPFYLYFPDRRGDVRMCERESVRSVMEAVMAIVDTA